MNGENFSVINKNKISSGNTSQSFIKGIFLFSLFFCLSIALFSAPIHANNLQVENVDLMDPDISQEQISVTFDISWDNSWRNNVNRDAVWVFVKYSDDAGETWKHATLKSEGINPQGFSSGIGTEINIIVPSDKKGCFIERSNVGAGTVKAESVKVLWDWNADGLSGADTARVRVFGVEMVYVPEGAFNIGDGDGVSESLFSFHKGSGNTSVRITDSIVNDISVDGGASDDAQITGVGIGVDGDNGIDTDNNGTVDNLNYPTGYEAFYIMKYELTEDQWVGFFNTLDVSERMHRDITGANGKNDDDIVLRNTVSWSGIGSAATLRPDRACSYLSWMDVCAYADWAALRPLTELEYEKSARGTNTPVLNEFSWGTTAIDAATTISGSENGTETVLDDDANCNYNNNVFLGGDSGSGPLRSGIFANEVSTKISSGAGYYGAMELTGNLEERCVTLGNAQGRNFNGTHGDGLLSQETGFEGNATNSDWPGYVQDQGVTGASGAGFRGGKWSDTVLANLHVSGRTRAAVNDISRQATYGGRLARSAS